MKHRIASRETEDRERERESVCVKDIIATNHTRKIQDDDQGDWNMNGEDHCECKSYHDR